MNAWQLNHLSSKNFLSFIIYQVNHNTVTFAGTTTVAFRKTINLFCLQLIFQSFTASVNKMRAVESAKLYEDYWLEKNYSDEILKGLSRIGINSLGRE